MDLKQYLHYSITSMFKVNNIPSYVIFIFSKSTKIMFNFSKKQITSLDQTKEKISFFLLI